MSQRGESITLEQSIDTRDHQYLYLSLLVLSSFFHFTTIKHEHGILPGPFRKKCVVTISCTVSTAVVAATAQSCNMPY